MQRNIILVAVAVILSVFVMRLLPQTQNAVPLRQNVFQHVVESGILRCGYAAWEPMMIVDPNTKQLSGISYDIMEEVGKKLGVKIAWTEETSWGDYPQGLKNGRFDAFCTAGYPNSQRARVIQFTQPFLYTPVNLYVRAEDDRFDKDVTVLDDPYYKLVYIDGSTPTLVTHEVFPHAGYDELPQLSQFANLFMELNAKKADAVLIDGATANYFIKKNPNKIKLLKQGIRVFPNVLGIAMGEAELQQALGVVLYELNDAGIIDRIVKKYEPLPDTYYHAAPGYAK